MIGENEEPPTPVCPLCGCTLLLGGSVGQGDKVVFQFICPKCEQAYLDVVPYADPSRRIKWR